DKYVKLNHTFTTNFKATSIKSFGDKVYFTYSKNLLEHGVVVDKDDGVTDITYKEYIPHFPLRDYSNTFLVSNSKGNELIWAVVKNGRVAKISKCPRPLTEK